MCSGISRYNGKDIKFYTMLLQKFGSAENALKHGSAPVTLRTGKLRDWGFTLVPKRARK